MIVNMTPLYAIQILNSTIVKAKNMMHYEFNDNDYLVFISNV